MSKFRYWFKETAWIVIPTLLGLWFVIWVFGYNKESYYRYEVRVIFCDTRPPRIVDHYGQRCPEIDYREEGRYHSQALSVFEYNTLEGHHHLLNVCEVQILRKHYLGDFTYNNRPY